MIIQDTPWSSSGHWEEDGVLYVNDRYAYEMERGIFRQEQDSLQKGLIVQVSPLLGAVTCCYHFSDGESETYELVIMQRQEVNALRLYRNDGGRFLPVHYSVVPFSYNELRNALIAIPDTKPFVEILGQPALQWLAQRDFSLDRIVIVSEFIRYDYPPVYWFIVANSRVSDESADGVIDREFLSCCLGVCALQSSQLNAMRRLNIDECSDKVVGNVLEVLAKKWSLIKTLLVHEAELDADLVFLLGIILEHIPDIIRCRWFTYQYIATWLWSSQEPEQADICVESVATQFLVEWFSLHALGFNPASLDSGHRMIYVIEREATALIRSGRFYFRVLKETVQSSIHGRFQSEIEEALNRVNDFIYNDDDSEIWSDNDPFPVSQLWHTNTCFTPVKTVGELRAIAIRLDNCAASRVAEAMRGNGQLWVYQSEDGELALLQLEVMKFDITVAEFKGLRNAPVSDMAQLRLDKWLSINRILSAGIDDAA